LETGEFIRMGASTVQKTNVRVVAATNLNMQEAIREGRFREDLYYRLNTVEIKVPALRDRKDDIPMLFRKFAMDFSEKYRMPAVRLNDEATELLKSYYWNGNVRQLKNVAEQMSVIEHNHDINADTLRKYLPENERQNALTLGGNKTQGGDTYMNERELLYKVLFDMKRDMSEMRQQIQELRSSDRTTRSAEPIEESRHTQHFANVVEADVYAEEVNSMEEVEKEMIRKTLEKTNGNRREAARILGKSERTLYRKIKDFGL